MDETSSNCYELIAVLHISVEANSLEEAHTKALETLQYGVQRIDDAGPWISSLLCVHYDTPEIHQLKEENT